MPKVVALNDSYLETARTSDRGAAPSRSRLCCSRRDQYSRRFRSSFRDVGVRPHESTGNAQPRHDVNRFVRRWLYDFGCSAGANRISSEPVRANDRDAIRRFADQYCVACHNSDDKTAGLALELLSAVDLNSNSEAWERVVKKLNTRQMPPADEVRPPERAFNSIVPVLEASLDRAAALRPNPGRTLAFRRLNRTEYQNAIRDLLALSIDAGAMLPNDDSSHGFDNITVGDLSPTLLDRYITAAQRISRLAIGSAGRSPGGDSIRVRPDVTQEEHVEGLPIGTRGGTLIPYTFPQDGEL